MFSFQFTVLAKARLPWGYLRLRLRFAKPRLSLYRGAYAVGYFSSSMLHATRSMLFNARTRESRVGLDER